MIGQRATSPTTSPTYVLYRENITAADAGPYTTYRSGLTMDGHARALIQLVPKTGTGNPVAKIYYWSNGAGKYVLAESGPAAAGAGVATEFTVNCYGRQMFVEITGTLTGGVDVYVSGYPV